MKSQLQLEAEPVCVFAPPQRAAATGACAAVADCERLAEVRIGFRVLQQRDILGVRADRDKCSARRRQVRQRDRAAQSEGVDMAVAARGAATATATFMGVECLVLRGAERQREVRGTERPSAQRTEREGERERVQSTERKRRRDTCSGERSVPRQPHAPQGFQSPLGGGGEGLHVPPQLLSGNRPFWSSSTHCFVSFAPAPQRLITLV